MNSNVLGYLIFAIVSSIIMFGMGAMALNASEREAKFRNATDCKRYSYAMNKYADRNGWERPCK